MLVAYLTVVGIPPSVAKAAPVKSKELAMATSNSTPTASFAHPALRKVVLATFLAVSVMMGGLVDAHAESLDASRMHDTSFRTAGIGDAGEGASYRTSERGDAGEGASFRVSGPGDAGEGASFRTSGLGDAGEGASFRTSGVGDAGEGPARPV